MVNFEKIKQEISEYDDLREELIKKSRDVLKLSKQLIYAVHRDDPEAENLVNEIELEKSNMDKIVQNKNQLINEGSYKIAVQEYVEAILYHHYVKFHELKEMNVSPISYLSGLVDLPGELVRKAVYLAGKGEYDQVIKIRDLVDKIYGQLLSFDIRESSLRKRMDSIKYDLRKLEDLVLELKLKK
jgi:predicted translin family RNA/ssDNA-binding protein